MRLELHYAPWYPQLSVVVESTGNDAARLTQ